MPTKPSIHRPTRPRLTLNQLIPNMLTVLAFCSGMTAIRFAYESRWEHAVMAIAAAAILDALDGRIARLLKGTTKFGAELDSLSDMLCFGVTPAVVLYFWSLETLGRFGWVLVLLYSVACVLRLARFNTATDDPDPPAWAGIFFTGVPAPAAAGLALLPMIISFNLWEDIFRRPEVVALFLMLVSGLMVSRIPTYSFKKVKIRPSWILPSMLGVGLIAAGMLNAPWTTLSVVLAGYLVSIPFSVRSYRAMQHRSSVDAPDEDDKD